MATIYLRSTDGSDSDDGSTWALAKATLAAALTAAGAGGTVYVSQAHAETQASAMTLTSPGTPASPVRVLCVNDAAEPPTALATTATVSTSSTAAITFTKSAYYYGISFQMGVGASANTILAFLLDQSTTAIMVFDSCLLKVATTGGAAAIGSHGGTNINNDEIFLHLINTPLSFGNVGQTVNLQNINFLWEATPSAIAGSVPTILFTTSSAKDWRAELRGVDLSAMGSGKTLVSAAGACNHVFRFVDCKLGDSVAIVTGTIPGQGTDEVHLINCDSADTNYRYYYQDYNGTVQQETTIIRTGGASDGTTAISRKMVSSANTQFYSPLVLHPITIWNETVGSSVTATIEVVTDNVTLTDAEAWLEVEYLGTSGFPLSLFANDRAADIMATPANQTTSSATWTTTGLTTPVKQKLSVSFTPQEKGPITFRVHLAKASTTCYVCPKVDIA